jgi:hypothetical protein
MSDTHSQPEVADSEAAARNEESRSPETVAATVARLLANPRRIRRN